MNDWWHQIKVVAIDNEVPAGKYPRVTQRVGDSPPQYPNLEDEEDWEEGEEGEDDDEDTEEAAP